MPQDLNVRDGLFWMAPRIVIDSRRHNNTVSKLSRSDVGASLIIDAGTRLKPSYYLATARHVVEDAEDGTVIFLQSGREGNAPSSSIFEYRRKERFGEIWYYPRDTGIDVAITPLSSGELGKATDDVHIRAVPLTMGVNRYLGTEATATHHFEEVLFVGYPEGLWDPASGFPIVRRGVTATSLQQGYHGEQQFLIDGAVYSGCSGGPVVILEREMGIVPARTLFGRYHPLEVTEKDRFAFVGMITDVLKDPGSGEARLNLGVAVKSRVLFEVIYEYERLIAGSA